MDAIYFNRESGNSILINPRIECMDGFTFSMQASNGHYSTPRNNAGPYTHVELGYPGGGEFVDEELETYNDGDGIYAYVPVQLILREIRKHGGVKGKPYRLIGGVKMRKIQDWKTGTSFQGAIYKDDGEYIVKFRDLEGKSLPDSDYFTNDLQDAKDTCDHQINWASKV